MRPVLRGELDRDRHAAIAEVLAFVHALRGDFTKTVVVQTGAEKLKGADTRTSNCLTAYRLKFSPMLADVVAFDRLTDAQ